MKIKRDKSFRTRQQEYLNSPDLRNLDVQLASVRTVLEVLVDAVEQRLALTAELDQLTAPGYLETLDKAQLIHLLMVRIPDATRALQALASVPELLTDILAAADSFARICEREARIEREKFTLSVAQTQLFNNELAATIIDVSQQLATEFVAGRLHAVTQEEMRERIMTVLTQRMQRNQVLVPLGAPVRDVSS